LAEIHLVCSNGTESLVSATDDLFAAAFALSSGTIGAALSSSLSKVRSIALSYGTMVHPTPNTFLDPAHMLSCRIIKQLWNSWSKDEGGLRNGEVDLYNINVPLVEDLLTDGGLKICWTTMWRNGYGPLFKALPASEASERNQGDCGSDTDLSGPVIRSTDNLSSLAFKFSPDMKNLINPSLSSLPIGSDAWGIHGGWATVTPLRATYAEPSCEAILTTEQRTWKMKL
jgi:tubulin--tyrosine ligase